ncbi:hypothetical protein C8F01DRAFT_1091826 [Mycena amicta]|nr:hypothetical protein C8F01DRAFT_1091826 [Mycena amicta]
MPPTPILMPARGAHTAPKFDSSKPEEFRRYFADVEYLLDQAQIVDETDMKRACTRYLSVQDQELCEGLDEFSKASKTFAEFKKTALALYAGNDEDHLYTLKDWDALLGSVSRRGIHTNKELATFYRDFVRMGKFLIGKKRLSETEQSHAFLRALQPATLQTAVKQRLQILKPYVHADDPYDLADLFQAAKFALAGSTYSVAFESTPAVEATTKGEESEMAVLLKAVTQLVQVMSSQGRPPVNSDGNNQGSGSNAPRRDRPRMPGCGYCGDLSHMFRDCPPLAEDKQKAGTFPPFMEGVTLRARFLKWHEQNPGQAATTQLVVELATNKAPAPAFILTDEQRAETLMAELNAVRTRMNARKALEASANQEPKIAKPVAAFPEKDNADHVNPAVSGKKTGAAAAPPTVEFPAHPFAAARDAAYAPPTDRNVGAIPKPNMRPPPPICQDGDARKVFDSALDAQFVISNRDLLSVAPDIRTLYRDAVTPRRAPAKDAGTQLLNSTDDDDPLGPLARYTSHETLNEQRARDARETSILDHLPAAFTNAAAATTPTDGYVVPDPFAVDEEGNVAFIIEHDPASPDGFIFTAYQFLASDTPHDVQHAYLSACTNLGADHDTVQTFHTYQPSLFH